MAAQIFISFASEDAAYTSRIMEFLEKQGISCWASFRDVEIGANYQHSITQAIRSARIMLVILSNKANGSSEIEKELSLASRYKLLVIPLRVEDIEPNDALLYELATRQWIDLFKDWDFGCNRLLNRVRGALA